MIRAAIIGLGRWGRSLVNSVQDGADDIRFVAGHTRTRAKVEDFCRDKGVRLVDDFGAILSDPGIDAVVLATPHSRHAEQIKKAAAAGKHILVEKPITLDHASAQAAVAAAQKAGVLLAVGYCRRFHPSVGELRQRLADGRLGKIVAIVAQHTTSTSTFIPPDNWRADPDEAPAGAMTAVGLHALDLMIEFAGRVRAVQCVTARFGDGPFRRHHHRFAALCRWRHRHDLLLGRDRHEFQLQRLRLHGFCGSERRGAAAFPFRADVAAGANRPGAGAA